MRPSFDLAYEARRATLAELLTSQSVPLTMTPGLTCTYHELSFKSCPHYSTLLTAGFNPETSI